MSTFFGPPAIRRAVVAGIAAVALGAGGAALTGCGLIPKAAPSPSATGLPQAAESPSPSAGPGFPDVCKLFTNDEIGALTKATITDAKPDDKSTKDQPDCAWSSADGGAVTTIYLANKTKAKFDDESGGYQAVTGIGDGAYENHGILTVLHGTTEITVIFGGGGDDSIAVQKSIAQKVIDKLDNPSPSPSAS
ncbi:DUF3558 family protein [Fodinicola acaciae]|uniref:DUF3558 family protein n=1 Tax=Fodinicola acaciae TaxID=2681555 RepID=UPI0013CFB78F|nr:DUF3558 family protein [Fodinicola acaciae]